jgi:ferredoxin
MRVKIDYDLCMGDGHCSEICPEVFEYDEEKTEARVIVDTIPQNLEDRAKKAIEECDVDAIIVEE